MNLFFKRILQTAAYGFLLASVAAIGLGAYAVSLLSELPSIEEIRRVRLNIPLRIYSADNELLAEYGNERRIPVPLDQTPPLLIDAILAIEDDRFYHHSGVDYRGILRAFLSNLRSKSRAQGGSTITMQVARNFFLTPEKTYVRKIKEVLLAFNMERALDKDEILELYLNKIFLGNRAYGFAAASQVYYGVELSDLSVPEVAMLAGLPKAPSRDNPITDPERAVERRGYVLKRLYELGKIDDFSYDIARRAPVTAARHSVKNVTRAPYAAEMARQIMFEQFGERVYDAGYRVTVTINSEFQTYAGAALRKGLINYDRRHGFRGAPARMDMNAIEPDDLPVKLLSMPSSRELQPAVVLSVTAESIFALMHRGKRVRIDWQNIKWAKPYVTPNKTGDEPTAAYQVVRRGDVIHVAPAGKDGKSWRLAQIPKVSGALVTLDPQSGAIRALSGGFDYYLSKFNRATQARRQPGSNIKPFIYSAALDHGFTPASLVSATPIVIEDPLEGIWRPQNYSRKFFGPTRLRYALSKSLNLVAVRLVRSIGIDATIAHLEKFGFDSLPRSFSLALGSVDITPLRLAAGFAVFANGGNRITPYLIERIVDGDGKPVLLTREQCMYCRAWPEVLQGGGDGDGGDINGDADINDAGETVAGGEVNDDGEITDATDTGDTGEINSADKTFTTAENTAAEDDRVISEQNAFLIGSMLQQVIRSGTGRRALALKREDLAGKTGTTNNFHDAWFSGFNRDLITTVFVGFDDPSHLGRRESGALAALPIWVDFMGKALKDAPESPPLAPPGIITQFINQDTGLPTAADDANGYEEFFMEGKGPAPGAAADAVDELF